ncbi:hypothetical protein Vadar_027618 [Vaccinium darrowii]|uniref:Uncharacterized protein n=1 Tax=Vaccinium darrowii TaxID=229202 RepID=A0ACB7Z6M5_9ERIC|nr:hypothetical protein Vadar_027618 [Vaccinium darrowii]
MTEEDKRVPLLDTPLLKYYYKEHPEELPTLRSMKAIHRDEFIRCSQCRKERRFRLRTAAECRAFHDALAKVNWTCSDYPCKMKTCQDPEERKSRKLGRGCPRSPRSPRCPGCMLCVCVGCVKCRFKGCPCRTCVDFMENIWR